MPWSKTSAGSLVKNVPYRYLTMREVDWLCTLPRTVTSPAKKNEFSDKSADRLCAFLFSSSISKAYKHDALGDSLIQS